MVLSSSIVAVGFVEFSVSLLEETLVKELLFDCCKKNNGS